MRTPSTAEEEKADDEDNYYPYKGSANEKDFLLRVYNGSKFLPKKKARMIKGNTAQLTKRKKSDIIEIWKDK
jgi:hypothetical protein